MTLVQLGESADSRGIENRAKMTNPTLDFADDFCKRGIVHIFAALRQPTGRWAGGAWRSLPRGHWVVRRLVRRPLSDGPVGDRQLAMRCCERLEH